MGRVWHQIYSNSGQVKCGTWQEKGINIARHCVNGSSMTSAPERSVTHLSFWWCVYVSWIQGAKWQRYVCNAKSRPGDGKHVILRQRVCDSVRAIRAGRNTRVFLMETMVVADDHLRQIMHQPNWGHTPGRWTIYATLPPLDTLRGARKQTNKDVHKL